MKHNLLKSVIISVILLMGVSNAWAYDVKSPHVYFNATNVSSWPGVNIVVGHDSYSFGDLMSKVSYTNLYYAKVTFNGTDANGFVFIGANSEWGEYKNQSLYNRTQSQSNRTDYLWFYNTITDGLPSGTYYFSTSGNKQAIDYSQYTTIPTFNTTSAVRVRTGASGTYSNASGTYPANISIQGTYISGDGKTNRTSITSTKSSDEDNKKVYGSVITGLVTLSYSNLNEAYTFDGWGTSNSKVSSTSTNYEFSQSANTTVYAFFTKKTYTITYKQGANGSGSIDAGIKEHGVNYTLSSNKFTRTGYTQTGWSTSDGGAKVYDLGGTYTANTDVTLYPFWTLAEYTITYDNLKGATHTNPATYTINSATITFTAPTSKPAGYTFANWSPASIATGSTGNKTVTANWTAATSTVELNQEEATEKGTASVTATYGSAMPAITKLPIRTGYTFGGYYTGKNGAGTQYYKADGTSATTWNLEGAQTLYAKWTPITYSVKFNGNGSTSGSMSNQSFTYDEAAKALTTNAFKKTGYTFAGWNTKADGTGTKFTDGEKVQNLTAENNSIYNIYAQWTINQYTLTYSAGEGGTVSGSHTSGTQIDYNTSVTLTATPAEGNALNQWVDENGDFVSYANPYTFNLTKNTTLKAEFTPSTTVYLKPEDYWKSDNACFAIVASATGKSNRTIDMENVDCNNEYYSANIPTGYTTFKYVRLNPANKNQVWNQTGTLNVENAMGKMYVTPRIYLKPDNNWKSDNARFAVYFWKSSNTSKNTWRSLTHIGNDIYTCQTPGESYDRAIFCRMNPNTVDNNFDDEVTWNKTNDLYIDHNSIAGKNLYTVTKATSNFMTGEIGEWHTHWETFAPTYTVTLEKTTYGKYAVELNGQKYYSSQSEDVVINNVPVKSTLRLVSSESFNAAYNNNMCIQTHDGVDFEKLNAEHRICGNTVIKENFTTLADHTVYLRVSTSDNEINTNWNQDGHYNYIYSDNNIGGQVITTTSLPDGEIYKEIGYNYYKFIIPAGCRTFRFERKTDPNVYYASNTENFLRYLPLGTSNCYTIEKKISDNSDGTKTFNGSWGMSLANGDYRLLYVEQVVEKSVITRKKAHPSDIIKKGTPSQIVSLHVYKDEENNPEVILQKFSDGTWTNIKRHMVLGNDGIEIIKKDSEAGRVWNFTVKQEDGVVTLPLDKENLKPYEGQYYIRTDNSEGGWMDYTIPGNYMTYSQYAKDHSGFSHYFCKWVEVSKNKNTKFVIANDYGTAISDTLVQDAYTNEDGDITHDANIRWSWNMVNNEIARAYIQGTWDANTSTRNENLVVNYKSSSSAAAVEALLDDNGDWIYQKDFTVKVGSHLNSLTAQYPASTGSTQTFASNLDMLTGDPANTNDYKVRILYDFKINKTLIALVPDNGKSADIAIDVVIERENQGLATQVQAPISYVNNQRSGEGATVYAVMSFTQNHITGGASKYAKQFYWISFPFDVRVSDVFGFGEYGKHWIIQWYDGAERAKNGCWIDSPTYWRFQTDTTDYVLEAGKGYVLTLDLAEMDVFANTNKVSLYFPSRQTVRAVDGDIIHDLNTTTLAPYTCTIQRDDRNIKDSHWHMLGVPSYANKNKSFTQNDVAYFYTYDSSNDTYNVTSSGSFNFNSMFSYMVQFAGTINWSQFAFDANGSQGLAAKRNTDNANDKHVLRLELQKNNASVDQTFVQLQAEEATEMFDMNLDLTKMVNSGNNIYSLIPGTESNIEVAANVMPITETIIPVGVKITAAGEYTFRMPEGTDGILVELIDYENNTRTNMLLDSYTVNLEKGTFDNRFALHVKPNKTTTSLENINTNSNGVKKYLIDGILYMQKDGVLYDAQGKLVR